MQVSQALLGQDGTHTSPTHGDVATDDDIMCEVKDTSPTRPSRLAASSSNTKTLGMSTEPLLLLASPDRHISGDTPASRRKIKIKVDTTEVTTTDHIAHQAAHCAAVNCKQQQEVMLLLVHTATQGPGCTGPCLLEEVEVLVRLTSPRYPRHTLMISSVSVSHVADAAVSLHVRAMPVLTTIRCQDVCSKMVTLTFDLNVIIVTIVAMVSDRLHIITNVTGLQIRRLRIVAVAVVLASTVLQTILSRLATCWPRSMYNYNSTLTA